MWRPVGRHIEYCWICVSYLQILFLKAVEGTAMQYPLLCYSHWLSFFFSDPRGITITPSPFGYSLFKKSESLPRVTKSLKGLPIAKKSSVAKRCGFL